MQRVKRKVVVQLSVKLGDVPAVVAISAANKAAAKATTDSVAMANAATVADVIAVTAAVGGAGRRNWQAKQHGYEREKDQVLSFHG
jgi:hypothetical protein